MREGVFPAPVSTVISTRRMAEAAVAQWIKERIDGAT